MTLKDLKQQIESKKLIDKFIIFKGQHTFVARQYISAICRILHLPIEYVDDLNQVVQPKLDVFGWNQSEPTLKLHNVDVFEFTDYNLNNHAPLIVMTKKVESRTSELYKEYIIELEQLEDWQIQDYLYSILDGVDRKLIDWLIKRCNSDIDRLQMEADKLLLFEPNERSIILNQMLEENAFSDTVDDNIFDFTDAIVKRDINRLGNIYKNINSIDIENIGVHTVLYKNFIKLVQVWLSANPSPQVTGLSSKQIYAINRLPRVWSHDSLINIIQFLTEIDYRVKTGDLPVNHLRDYIVINVLSR